MPYLGMNVPICPLCVFSLQLGPIRGKKKRFAGTISRFRRPYKGPNYEGLNAPLMPLCQLCAFSM